MTLVMLVLLINVFMCRVHYDAIYMNVEKSKANKITLLNILLVFTFNGDIHQELLPVRVKVCN